MGAYENGVILFLKNACSFLADYTESIAPKELNLFCLFFQRKIDDYILDFYSDVYLRSPTSYDHSENFLKQSSDIWDNHVTYCYCISKRLGRKQKPYSSVCYKK